MICQLIIIIGIITTLVPYTDAKEGDGDYSEKFSYKSAKFTTVHKKTAEAESFAENTESGSIDATCYEEELYEESENSSISKNQTSANTV